MKAVVMAAKKPKTKATSAKAKPKTAAKKKNPFFSGFGGKKASGY